MDKQFYKCCRICANEELIGSVNMFSDVGKRHQLPDKIRLCLPITVDEDDELPKEVCITCLNKLDVCNELYMRSFTAQNILKSKFDLLVNQEKDKPKKNLSVDKPVSSSGDLPSVPCTNISQVTIRTEKLTESPLTNTVGSAPLVSNTIIAPKTINEIPFSQECEKGSGISFDLGGEQESEIPQIGGIVVTDITGAPLETLGHGNNYENENNLDKSINGDVNMCKIVSVESISDNVHNAIERVEDSPSKKRKKSSEITSVRSVKKSKRKDYKSEPSTLKKIKVKCKICNQWVTKTRINIHLRLHLQERMYSCVDCGVDFKSENDLSLHTCNKD